MSPQKRLTRTRRRIGSVEMLYVAGLFLVGLFSPALEASGKTPTAPNAAEIRISTETAPAGRTAQVKFSLTEPRPILSSGTKFYTGAMSINGVAIWSSTGDAGGLGVLADGVLTLNTVDPSGVLGMNVDYPFLTVTMDTPASLPAGTVIPLNWTDSWLNSTIGPLALTVKPGKITIGGSVSIQGVYPGGGTYPAGTVIRIPGAGFLPSTRLQTAVRYSSMAITPNEITLTLKEQTTMDAQSFQVTNIDGSSDTYFAYLRGSLIKAPSRPLLSKVEPAFPLRTHGAASIGPLPMQNPGQFAAVAIQNPSSGPIVITLTLKTQGPDQVSQVYLPVATRVVDELGSLLGGAVLQAGDTVQITGTSAFQILGINGDENLGIATPFLPIF